MREITIGKNDSGKRVDRFLMKYLNAPSGFVFRTLRKNGVRLNGKHPKPEAVLTEGDTLTLYLKDEVLPSVHFTPGNSTLDIVYEDSHILVVNKPPMLPCQPDIRHKTDTLIDRVKSNLYIRKEFFPEEEHTFQPALCNRIDTNTCGLVIAAKDAESLRTMNEKIRSREVRKYYLALVEGHLSRPAARLEGNLTKEEAENRSYIGQDGKAVSLSYQVKQERETDSLVEIELHTGRSHQIRAQFAAIGHPLVGDKKYGGSTAHGRSYQALYAYRLVFDFTTDAGVLNDLKGKEIILPNLPF